MGFWHSILKCSIYWESRERVKDWIGAGWGRYWSCAGGKWRELGKKRMHFYWYKKKSQLFPISLLNWVCGSSSHMIAGLEVLAGECSSSYTPGLKVVLLHWRKLPFLINRQLWEACVWRVRENWVFGKVYRMIHDAHSLAFKWVKFIKYISKSK